MNKNVVKKYEIQFRLILVLMRSEIDLQSGCLPEERAFVEEIDQLNQNQKREEDYEERFEVFCYHVLLTQRH